MLKKLESCANQAIIRKICEKGVYKYETQLIPADISL